MTEMEYATAMRTRTIWADHEGFEDILYDYCHDLATRSSAMPEEYGIDMPEEGAWIMVKRQPHTVIASPPLYSMWRARPVFVSLPIQGRRGVIPGGSRTTVHWPLLRARIVTPYGELTFLGDEFVIVKKLPEWMEQIGDGVSLYFMGPGVVEGDLVERVFQLRARGLRQRDALSLLLPEITDQGFCWLSLDGTGADEYISLEHASA
jgi:hypothetical protein